MLVKRLKIENLIKENFYLKSIDEEGNEFYNVPTDLTTLKKYAIDTIDWEVEQELKYKANAVNSKLALFALDLVLSLSPDLSKLTASQKVVIENYKELKKLEYIDSQIAEQATSKLVSLLKSSYKIGAVIMSAKTIEEVLEKLNSFKA